MLAKKEKSEMHEQATMFGRGTPPSIKAAARKLAMTSKQRRRQQFLNEENAKTLRSLIAQYANSKRHFAIVQQWRKELLKLHEEF
jgi:hypothetical protein